MKDCLEMFGLNSRRILGNVGKMGYESSDGIPKPKKKMAYVPSKLGNTGSSNSKIRMAFQPYREEDE